METYRILTFHKENSLYSTRISILHNERFTVIMSALFFSQALLYFAVAEGSLSIGSQPSARTDFRMSTASSSIFSYEDGSINLWIVPSTLFRAQRFPWRKSARLELRRRMELLVALFPQQGVRSPRCSIPSYSSLRYFGIFSWMRRVRVHQLTAQPARRQYRKPTPREGTYRVIFASVVERTTPFTVCMSNLILVFLMVIFLRWKRSTSQHTSISATVNSVLPVLRLDGRL